MSGIVFHGTMPNGEVMRITSNGNIGIGTTTPNTRIVEYNEWTDILKAADTNPAVKIALDRLKTTYYLSKENGSKT